MADKGKLVAVRMARPQAAMLADYAVEHNTTVSDIVRRAVRAYLRAQGKDRSRKGTKP